MADWKLTVRTVVTLKKERDMFVSLSSFYLFLNEISNTLLYMVARFYFSERYST